MRLRSLFLLVLAATASSTAARGDAPATRPAPDRTFFPLGVYWPWETTSVAGQGITRSARLTRYLEERLDDLAAHNVNLVWTVNGPDTAAELGLLCRLAETRGIRVVAGSGRWAMPSDGADLQFVHDGVQAVRKVWHALEGRPRPIAFTLSDEPRAPAMPAFGRYAALVAESGIPVTTVVTWQGIEPATKHATSLTYLAADVYPFFGSHLGPRGDSSYHFYIKHARAVARLAPQAGVIPWMMPQAFQEIAGPWRTDAVGNVTVLKGGGTHWVMPAPQQIRWQAWTAVATGNKGVIFFTYGTTAQPDPTTKTISHDWAEPEPRDTGAPISLVAWPSYRPGAQYQAMANVYAEIAPLIPLLRRLEPVVLEGNPVRIEASIAGDLVSHLRDRRSGDLYVAVVASPKRQDSGVRLTSDRFALRTVGSGDEVDPSAMRLEPGQGAIYRLDPK